MKWKVACAVLLAIAIGEGVLLAKGVLEDVKEAPVATLSTDPPETPVEPDRALELARLFRPILQFDTKETWRPLEVDLFLEEARAGNEFEHQLCDRALPPGDPDYCKRVGGIGRFEDAIKDLPLHGTNHFIDVAGGKPNGEDFRTPEEDCGTSTKIFDCNEGASTAIYYQVRDANGRYYVDYWWYYRYNDFPEFDAAQRCENSLRPACGDHEGDWEGITVVTSPSNRETVGYVTYAAHDTTNNYAAPQLGLDDPGETRPTVYVADGSHASYPDTCFGGLPVIGCQQLAGKVECKVAFVGCKQLAGRVSKGLPEGTYDGAVDWGRNTRDGCDDDPDTRRNDECLQPLPPLSDEKRWNAFTGHWGRVCAGGADCHVMRGPKSPGQQPRYQKPWCAHKVAPDAKTVDEKPSCDVVTPATGNQGDPGVATSADCDAWGGVSVSVLACDRETLADTLANPEGDETQSISVRIDGEEAGETATRGVAQAVGKPLRAPETVTIAGRVSDLLIRARQPSEQRPKDLVEARFERVGLRANEEATVKIRYRDGEVKLMLFPPVGDPVKPNSVIRPLKARAPRGVG